MTNIPDEAEQLAEQIRTPISESDSFNQRATRLRWLGEKIECGVATEEEVAEFKQEYSRLVEDLTEVLNPLAEACADAVSSMAEEVAEPMEEIAKPSNFSPPDPK
jgi:hypothetical protein